MYLRVDGHSSLTSLKGDKSLEPLGIFLVIGRPKNVNKNATVDKAIREFRDQLIRLQPRGGPYSPSILAQATYFLNSIIRHSGRSARELWLSRDQQTGANIALQDSILSDAQFQNRQLSHSSSAKYASRGGDKVSCPRLSTGDTVFVKSDLCKSKARESYLVLSVDDINMQATIQKFPMSKFRQHTIIVEYQNLYKLPARTLTAPSCPIAISEKPKTSQPSLPKLFLSNTPVLTPDSDSESSSSCDDSFCDDFPCNDSSSIDSTYVYEELELDQVSDEDTYSGQAQDPPTFEQAQVIPNSDKQPSPQVNSIQNLHLYQPLYGQRDYLHPGDVVLLVHGDSWCKVILHSHTGVKDVLNGSLYWNYYLADGSHFTCGYLFPGESWGVLRGGDRYLDISQVNIVLPQIVDRVRDIQ